MKRKAFESEQAGLLRSVKSVADHRIVDGLQMHAELMGATGMRTKFKKSRLFGLREYAILGYRVPFLPFLATRRRPDDRIVFAARYRPVDNSVILFDSAVDKRVVHLLNPLFLKLLFQKLKRLLVFDQHQHPRGFFIETMHNARPQRVGSL